MMYLNYSLICRPTVLPTGIQLGVWHREHAGRAADVGRRASGIGEEAEQHRRSPKMAPSCEYQRRDSDDGCCFLLGILRLNIFFYRHATFSQFSFVLCSFETYHYFSRTLLRKQSSRCFNLHPNLSNQRDECKFCHIFLLPFQLCFEYIFINT